MRLPFALAEQPLRKYLQTGVAIDTELLLLAAVGGYKRSYIREFKRTDRFSPEDYDILAHFLSKFRRFVLVPHVLAEVSNLSFQVPEARLNRYLDSLIRLLLPFKEDNVDKGNILSDPAFRKLGATDTALILCCQRGGYLLLTRDRQLSGTAEQNRVGVMHFDDLRIYSLNAQLGL